MDTVQLRKIAESRKSEFLNRRAGSLSRWAGYLSKLDEHYSKEGRILRDYQRANIAQACDNVMDHYVLSKMESMNEATTSDAIAFAKQMLPTIPALLPSLVADEISVVQTIDRPKADIYYLDVLAAGDKGSINDGDVLIGAKTGHLSSRAARSYASDEFVGDVIATAPGGAATQAIQFTAFPIIPGTIEPITVATSAGNEIFTDAGNGTFTGSLGGTGTYNAATGTGLLDPNGAATVTAGSIVANYQYNVELAPSATGGLKVRVVNKEVNARTFPLRVEWSVFAAVLMQKVHGMVLADETMKIAVQEIRYNIDQVVLEAARQAALSGVAAQVGNFDVSTAPAEQPWIWRIQEFKKFLSKAANNIHKATRRGRGNVLTCGYNVFALVENMQEFKPASGVGVKPPAGPYVAGTLGSYLVIVNPEYDQDEYVVQYRGDSYLDAGIVFAPYVPLYSTDPITLANLQTQRGFMSMAAIERVNDGLFCRGTISNYA